jgi:hypothetical protein
VLSGNVQSGVEISHNQSTLRNHVINNLIGTNLNGTMAPAYARNGQSGVNLEGYADCRVGEPPPLGTSDGLCPVDAGASTVRDNIIVNNQGGIFIHKGRHDDVVVENFIGVLADGITAAPNTLFGVRIEKGSFENTIGPGNVIARNNGPGVAIVPLQSNPGPDTVPQRTYSNTITTNRIFGNGTSSVLGIDLAPLGSTAPPDPLVNDGIRIPVLTAQPASAVTVTTSPICAGCTVELFLADGSSSQFGEGKDFLDEKVTDATGTAVFTVPQASGKVVTATITDTIGNTSEFSRNVTVQ